jgi:isocitrate dehydrogenase
VTRIEQDNLGTPVNKSLWNAVPAVVNAYYSRNKNQISKYMYHYIPLNTSETYTNNLTYSKYTLFQEHVQYLAVTIKCKLSDT